MTSRLGIIGHPVAHSLSPVFQGVALAHLGLDMTYERWDTPSETLTDRIQALRDPAVLGANVTIPHKEAVIPLMDELGGQAGQVGAVNTIIHRDGRLVGFNTDGPGFVRALRQEASFDVAGMSVLLLGAGGGARGIAFALAASGAARVAITNRTHDRAERLAADVAAHTTVNVAALTGDPDIAGFDAIVNCTSIGMSTGPDPSGLPCDLTGARPGTLVADIVYSPEDTPLLRTAAAQGLPTLPGLPMLIYQGALAFELWTGQSAPVDVMFTAAREAIAARAKGG
ncbi:MAG: shikimate dehydrogenase [Tepidiformaceae bacterium]